MMHPPFWPSSGTTPWATVLPVAAAVTVIAACGNILEELPRTQTGVVNVFVRSVAGQYVARPEAVFVFSTDGPTAESRATEDTCRIGEVVTARTLPSGLQFLDAGDSIALDVEGTTVYLRPVTALGYTSYVLATADLSITPGASVTFTIPGATDGFPPATISSLTPPALESLSPIPAAPPLDQPLAVTWTPAGDDSSRFEIALQYVVEGATLPNRQILCEWRDDGSSAVPPGLLGEWVATDVRRVEVTRYRTRRETVGEAVLLLLATFDSVPPVNTP
jgi:hypothetical protein